MISQRQSLTVPCDPHRVCALGQPVDAALAAGGRACDDVSLQYTLDLLSHLRQFNAARLSNFDSYVLILRSCVCIHRIECEQKGPLQMRNVPSLALLALR
jgi:hypothetical protein